MLQNIINISLILKHHILFQPMFLQGYLARYGLYIDDPATFPAFLFREVVSGSTLSEPLLVAEKLKEPSPYHAKIILQVHLEA